MRLEQIVLHRVRLPLICPYHVSYRVYEDFEPIIVEVLDADGRTGWGEGHISPGYSQETVDGGWAFCREQAARVLGWQLTAAKAELTRSVARSPVANTALITALEMLEGSPLLRIEADARIPLLTPFHATDEAAIPGEVERRLAEGFHTFKVKVGKDVDSDLARVCAVQQALAGRATIRLDANRGFSRADGCRFAAALDPAGIELFEQPCAAADWEANAAVARISRVPVMLDESIYDMVDIERAAGLEGVGFVKLKLKKLGSVERLKRGLERIRELGMEPVLGDGVAAEIGCWMEACVARTTIRNAGEMNGFLKPKARVFSTPLRFERGCLHLEAGFTPGIDRDALEAHRMALERLAAPRVAAPRVAAPAPEERRAVMSENARELDGTVAIVTGSARNIGRAIALQLAAAGAAVVINAKSSRAAAEETAAQISGEGGRAMVHMADLTRSDQVDAMVAETVAQFGRLDILVNNAALRRNAPITKISDEDWREITASILDAAFFCCRAAAPHLERSGRGAIVNIGGVAGHAGVGGRLHVVAAKAGIAGLTKGLAAELAPQGIVVNCVSPGYIGTERDHIPPHFQERPVPLGRPGRPDEIAAMVRYLCGPSARYITGQVVHVNGGWYMP